MDAFAVTTDWLRARARVSPEAAALSIDGRAWRFADLDALAAALAGRLWADGARPGDHVAVLLPNSLAAVVATFAVARLGAVLVPLNTRLTAGEVAWQVARADASRLLYAERRATPAAALPASVARLLLPAEPEPFAAWAADQPPLPAEVTPPPGLDRTQAIVFTSGTTGHAKGAQVTFANHFWSAIGSAFRLGVHSDDRWLACLPLYHVGGLAILLRSCLYGTAVVLHAGFDAAAVRRSLREESVTLLSLVPTMLGRLLHEKWQADEAPALRLVLLGGAAAPAALLAEAHAAGIPVATTYGLTEAASQVATRLPNERPDKAGSAGRPLLFTEVTILDDEGRPLPAGTPGEIAVAGPTVMAGYYGDEAATAAALPDGRLRTGDIGFLDADGDLWLLDRRADLIISGGENVYPAEVERVLREHPAVALAAVVGLPHPDWGQQVAAAVVLRRPGAATAEELLAHCRQQLAGYKCPRYISLHEESPQTASGKVQRHLVAKRLLVEERAAA